jgi:hypothetical protein
MYDDPDAQLGDVVRRLSQVRSEMGPGSFTRAVHATLGAIGAVVMEEAERQARSGDRRRPLLTDATVIPFASWQRSETWNDHG